MKKMRFLMPLGFVAMAAVFSVAVMLLWNALIPTIFGLAVINFWQALGLLALARILFGSFGHHGRGMMHGGMHGNHMREKWMKMTDEQRKEFINRRKEHMHRGHFFGGGFDFDDDSKKDNE